MRKLRIGVWIYEDYNPEVGGGYGYYNQIINALGNSSFIDTEICFISYSDKPMVFPFDNFYSIKPKRYIKKQLSFKQKLVNKITNLFGVTIYKSVSNDEVFAAKQELKKELKRELNQIIDIIYYPTSICIIDYFPYIYTLWDIGHLSSYAFPEVNMNNCYESRKQHHDLYPHKALMVFCESEFGKKEVEKYLNINKDRLRVIPIFPSEIIKDSVAVEQPFSLDEDGFFIHYPAQYWSHKNHYNLLYSFKMVLQSYPELKLVLTGSDKGNKDYILEIIETLSLTNSVLDLGFVKTEELKWVYLHSQGLVMPTLLGPTNMPLLEAASLGCPVACSNIEGHLEQLGNYGYYFNPLNQQEMAAKIMEMIADKNNNQLKTYVPKFTIENAIKNIEAAFVEIRNIRFCWGSNDEIF